MTLHCIVFYLIVCCCWWWWWCIESAYFSRYRKTSTVGFATTQVLVGEEQCKTTTEFPRHERQTNTTTTEKRNKAPAVCASMQVGGATLQLPNIKNKIYATHSLQNTHQWKRETNIEYRGSANTILYSNLLDIGVFWAWTGQHGWKSLENTETTTLLCAYRLSHRLKSLNLLTTQNNRVQKKANQLEN